VKIVVFKNSYKDTDRHPDYIIYRSEEGEDLVKVGALWLGKSSKGTDYMSGKIDDFDQPESEHKDGEEEVQTPDDDIPF